MTTNKGIRDLAILATLFGAGLRRGEVVSLNAPESYQVTEHGARFVVVGKGNKERFAPISRLAQPAIERWLALRKQCGAPHGPMFPRMNHSDLVLWEKRMSPQGIWWVTRQLAQLAGTEHFSPHDGRRTYASSALEAGADLMALQASMGHADLSTTQIYDHRGERYKS